MPKKLTHNDYMDRLLEILGDKTEALAKDLIELLTFATGYLKLEESDYSDIMDLIALLNKVLISKSPE